MSSTKTIIQRLTSEVASLGGRIFVGATPEKTKVPFATISTITSTPITTFHGLVGYEKNFEIVVVSSSSIGAQQLANGIIGALDRYEVDCERCYLLAYAYECYYEQDLHGYIIKFKIN